MSVTQVALIPGSVRETDSGPVPSSVLALAFCKQLLVAGCAEQGGVLVDCRAVAGYSLHASSLHSPHSLMLMSIVVQ